MSNLDYSFSKNYQDETIIRKMFEYTFNKDSSNILISNIEGGMKNAIYLIQDGANKYVLKIAPKNENLMLTFERNTMWWEVKMLKLMQINDIPAPKLLHYDSSCSLCDAPYFFMTYIDGIKLCDLKNKLSEQDVENIEKELGSICYKMSKIISNNFYIPSFPNKKFNSNYEFIKFLFETLIKDATNNNIKIKKYNYSLFINLLEQYKESLNNISNLCLVHSDIWDGNIIIKDNHLNGIVDFSDLYFCDELFAFYFHTTKQKTSKYFLEGYNKKKLNQDEENRIIIYRIFILLKMAIEKEYKHFDKTNQQDWIFEKLDNEISKLNIVKNFKIK